MFLGYGETQKYEDLEKLVIAKHAMSSGSIIYGNLIVSNYSGNRIIYQLHPSVR